MRACCSRAAIPRNTSPRPRTRPFPRQRSARTARCASAWTLRTPRSPARPPHPSADIIGIDVDVARYLADQMGLKVEIVDVGNDPAAALDGGKVDVVLGVDASEDDGTYWKSEPYLVTGVALFGTSTESSVPTLDSKPKIAAQASSKSSWRVTNLFGDDSLVAQGDLKSAFDAMNSGSARYVASDAVIGTYVAHSPTATTTRSSPCCKIPTGTALAVAQQHRPAGRRLQRDQQARERRHDGDHRVEVARHHAEPGLDHGCQGRQHDARDDHVVRQLSTARASVKKAKAESFRRRASSCRSEGAGSCSHNGKRRPRRPRSRASSITEAAPAVPFRFA